MFCETLLFITCHLASESSYSQYVLCINVNYTIPYCLTPACGGPPSVACSIRQSLFRLLQNSYRDGDRAPALVPEHCSQQLANVNLPDTHSRVGAPRQQQFSTVCEWDWRAICWSKSLIISTSLSGGGWCMGWQRRREEIKGGSNGWHEMSLW